MRNLPAPRALPVVGQPHRWALDLAVGGTLLPFTALVLPLSPMILTMNAGPGLLAFAASLLPLALATGLAGGLLGFVSPLVLHKLRGHVPLSLLTVLASTATAATMLQVALFLDISEVVSLLWLVFGAVFGTFLWLPYLVATALQKPTWPVVAVGLAASSAIASLCMPSFWMLL